MQINWKEIEFKSVYTRGIDREYNKILFDGSKPITVNWVQTLEIVPQNIQLANDYLITALTNLTTAEIDELAVSDYDKVLEEVNNVKNGEKSKGKN